MKNSIKGIYKNFKIKYFVIKIPKNTGFSKKKQQSVKLAFSNTDLGILQVWKGR